ncbi:MAG: hypothetical protein U0325_26345 [Polyangiales bacterium]
MSRHLAVSLEPSDAFLALLRLKAASEVGRWPAQLSGRFRGSLEREFASLESAVRTLGVCYADLEERGIASVDRAAHSRFGDIDSAIHLGACPIAVSVDLDHLKVALERGDRGTRASMASLASSLRMALWYAVRTDLLVCTHLQRSGEDLTPDAALRFVDGYLAAAWAGGDAPQPPLPTPEIVAELPGAGGMHTPSPPPADSLLPHQESTAVFKLESLNGLDPDLFAEAPAVSPGSMATLEMERLSLTATELAQMGIPRPPPVPSVSRPASLAPPPPPAPSTAVSFAELDGTVLPTLQLKLTDVLSEDAQFFLAQSGARWPCEASELDSAHRLLTERIRRETPRVADPAMASHWADKLARGYDELRRWTR